MQDDYQARLDSEMRRFAGDLDVHALPDIYHYWSNTYLRPKLEAFGYTHPEDFFVKELAKLRARYPAVPLRFASIGCGNCDLEVGIAGGLLAAGVTDFTIDCVDITQAMLERGRALAESAGVADNIRPIAGDFNDWRPDGRYHAVFANQSLHHVTALETLFDRIASALLPDGRFLVADIIGRNGHQRWPEALAIVREFWSELPDTYRYHLQLRRQEDQFIDWDCSVEGFEGIRAQDVLPLLIERFGFERFIAFANAIDPFIDRGFGHHFAKRTAWDRDFIDRVHARDEAGIAAGELKPVHLLAVLCLDRDVRPQVLGHLTPEFCVRRRQPHEPIRSGDEALSGWLPHGAMQHAVAYANMQAWDSDRAEHAATFDAQWLHARTQIRAADAEGVAGHCPLCDAPRRFVSHDRIADAPNLREGLVCNGCNCNARARAGLAMLRALCPNRGLPIYITEQVSAASVWLRKHYPATIGSEFVRSWWRRAKLSRHLRLIGGQGRVRFEDVTRLTLATASQRAVVSFDVLEHVADYRAALREFARVTAPDGWLILTAPFIGAQCSIERARMLADGRIEHLLPAEYHGDPLGDGVLCFHQFGWDLLDDLRVAGYRHAAVVLPWWPEAGLFDGLTTIIARR